MGSSSMGGIGLPSTPGALPSLTDQSVQLARGSALRQISAKRGLASTFLTNGGSINDTPEAQPVFTAKPIMAAPPGKFGGFITGKVASSQPRSLPGGMTPADLREQQKSLLGTPTFGGTGGGSTGGQSLLGKGYAKPPGLNFGPGRKR